MKKIVLFLSILLLVTQTSFAYNFSQKDKQTLAKLEKVIVTLESSKNINFFESRVEILKKAQTKVKRFSKNWYIINEVKKFFEKSLNNKIKETQKENTKDPIIHDNYNFEIDFFNKYWKDITTTTWVPDNCFKNYNIADIYGKRYNFPTALIIANWWIETNCNMSNPQNWYGLFQISSNYYAPWNVWTIELQDQIVDFINFSKKKWDYFNNNKYHNYKDRFWKEDINITYNNYSLRDIRLHGILYNWVSNDTTLDWNTFVNNNLNKNVVWNYDWLLTRLLKILYSKNMK